MAKKGSARRQPDPDLEDEELELDAPPKKKSSARVDKSSSAKSSTAKRKSAEGGASKNGSSSVSKKSLKESGKRKSASGSNPAASGRRSGGSDDDMGGSSRRRRAAPAKKKDNTVVIGVSVLSVTLLLVLGIVVINKNRTPVQTHDEQAQFDDYKKWDQEAMAAFREFNKADKEGNAGVANAKRKEAHDKWTKAIDILNGILENHKGADGYTLPEYEGYEEELSRITTYLVDLEKRGSLR